MSFYVFGSGTLVALPFGANAAGNPTPIQLGTMQDVSVEISFTQKELYGKNQFPVAIARAQGKIQCKSKFASLYAKALNDLFFGSTVGNAQNLASIDESHVQTTHTITITPPGSGVFVQDLGVRDAVSGAQLTLVATSPVAGQYTIAAAVYTFATGDTAAKLVSYTYSLATTGASVAVPNKPMGSMPTFQVWLSNSQFSTPTSPSTTILGNLMINLPVCISSKLSLGFKNEDFMVPDFEFSNFADASGNIMYLYSDQ